jgi:hypothetical protein
MNCGEFVGLLFLARDLAHKAHLRAKGEGSYARHVALNEFYEGIVELADKFAEQYQGRYGELLDVPLLDNEYEGDIEPVLREMMNYIDECRDEMVPRKMSSLHNVIDEIVGRYESTLYKLKFLK